MMKEGGTPDFDINPMRPEEFTGEINQRLPEPIDASRYVSIVIEEPIVLDIFLYKFAAGMMYLTCKLELVRVAR